MLLPHGQHIIISTSSVITPISQISNAKRRIKLPKEQHVLLKYPERVEYFTIWNGWHESRQL
jgi:hypothetical protein